MKEKDALIRAIVDPANRNLLDEKNIDLFAIDVSRGGVVRFQLQVENGPEAPIDVEISSDQPWLQPETKLLRLVGGQSGQCFFKAAPLGDTEFANVVFSWDGQRNKHQQAVMIRRVLPAPQVSTISSLIASPWMLAAVAAVIGLVLAAIGVVRGQGSLFAFFSILIFLIGLGSTATLLLLASVVKT